MYKEKRKEKKIVFKNTSVTFISNRFGMEVRETLEIFL